MSRREIYDDAHSKQMERINENFELSDIPEAFVKLPFNAVKEFFKSDTVLQAERDALNGKYNPPTD